MKSEPVDNYCPAYIKLIDHGSHIEIFWASFIWGYVFLWIFIIALGAVLLHFTGILYILGRPAQEIYHLFLHGNISRDYSQSSIIFISSIFLLEVFLCTTCWLCC